MKKVVVIGGGASGLIAAIVASFKNEVILLEKTEKCGKKILLTGNGRCNYWNQDISLSNYHTDSSSSLKEIIKEENQKEVLSFLEQLGIYPKIKNGYYYPYSNQASSIRTILLSEVEKRKIEVISSFPVESVKKEQERFILSSAERKIVCDQVILAAGSKACPKTGSDGSGYLLAKSLGHTIHPVTPALVQLKAKTSFLKDWNGVRIDAKIRLLIENECKEEEQGELLLTDYGISGICTLNVSGMASKNLSQKKRVSVIINFLPNLESSFYDWFTERNKKIPNHTIEELLESILPYQLMLVLLKEAKINRNAFWKDLTELEKRRLSDTIEQFPLEITGTNDFTKAQVATGGVSLKEVNPHTMESNLVKNFYLVGEVLDVDGKCGGFNLAFAWISGYLAGKDVSNDSSKTSKNRSL